MSDHVQNEGSGDRLVGLDHVHVHCTGDGDVGTVGNHLQDGGPSGIQKELHVHVGILVVQLGEVGYK